MIKSEYPVRTKEFVESELKCVVDQLVKSNTNWILESTKLFGNMRELTKEENKQINKYLDKVSESTDFNLFDYLKEN